MSRRKKSDKIPRWKRKKIQAQKKIQHAISDGNERLMQRLKSNGSLPEFELSDRLPDTEKMSNIIFEFAEPLLEGAQTITQERRVVEAAIAMWNFSLLSEKDQERQLSELSNIRRTGSHDSETFADIERDIFKQMSQRKKELFADIDRLIIDYEITETPKGIYLNVVSAHRKKEL